MFKKNLYYSYLQSENLWTEIYKLFLRNQGIKQQSTLTLTQQQFIINQYINIYYKPWSFQRTLPLQLMFFFHLQMYTFQNSTKALLISEQFWLSL